MTGRGRSLLHAAFGVAAGITGVAAGRCAGGACTTCLACAVPGLGVVVLGVLGHIAGRAKSPATAAPAAGAPSALVPVERPARR